MVNQSHVISQQQFDGRIYRKLNPHCLQRFIPRVLWRCWLGGGILAWLSVWGKVQICTWPSWCHCHSLALAPVNPDWFYLPSFTFRVPAHPGSPGQNPGGRETVVVVVVVNPHWHRNAKEYSQRSASNGAFTLFISPHLVWPHLKWHLFIWTECIVTDRSHSKLDCVLWTDPVFCVCDQSKCTQFRWNEVSWDKVGRGEVTWVIWSLHMMAEFVGTQLLLNGNTKEYGQSFQRSVYITNLTWPNLACVHLTSFHPNWAVSTEFHLAAKGVEAFLLAHVHALKWVLMTLILPMMVGEFVCEDRWQTN